MSSRIEPAIWQKIIKQNGFDQTSQGVLIEEPFQLLASRVQQAVASQPAYPVGRVNVGLNNGVDYGNTKVWVSISVPVLPMESDISLAGEAAFIKVRQMVNEASAAMGLDPLP